MMDKERKDYYKRCGLDCDGGVSCQKMAHPTIVLCAKCLCAKCTRQKCEAVV